MNIVHLVLGSGTALLATALGAACLLAFSRVNERIQALIMAFSAGIMAFAAFEMVDASHGLGGHRLALGGLFGGMLFFLVLDRILPHVHLLLVGDAMPGAKKKAALLAGTIALHNIPEGIAIAAAFADSTSLGWLVAVSIAIQDIPEGLLVAAPMACYGLSRRRAFLWGAFTGVVEMLAALGAFFALRAATAALPPALAFSGGAMAYVVIFELLPDALRARNKYLVAAVFIAGIAATFGLSLLVGR